MWYSSLSTAPASLSETSLKLRHSSRSFVHMVLRFSRTTYKSVFFRPVFQLEPRFHNQPPLFDTTSFTYKYRLACGYKTMLARYKKTNLRISCYLGIVSVKFILFSKKPVYKKQRIKNDKKNLALYFGFRKTSSILL